MFYNNAKDKSIKLKLYNHKLFKKLKNLLIVNKCKNFLK